MYAKKVNNVRISTKATRRFVLAVAFVAPLLWPTVTQAVPKFVTADGITVIVDEDVCAVPALLPCVQTGSAVPAADMNDSIVRLSVQLIKPNGVPFTGLTQSDFTVLTKEIPSGTGVSFASCVACFTDLSAGVYRLFVEPIPGTFWSTGSYILQLQIAAPGATLHTLFRVEIP